MTETSSAAPKVSVIVPAYNAERFLEEAVESALAQTFEDLEVIMVDDGSSDGTRAVAERLAADRRVEFVHQSNSGPSGARNTGIGRCRGTFVAFLDADDRWLPEKLERQMPLFDNAAVGLVYARVTRRMERDDQRVDRRTALRGRVFWEILEGNFVALSSAVVRRSCLDAVGGFDPALLTAEDTELYARLAHDYEFDYVDAALVEKRVHAKSISLRSDVRPATLGALRKIAERYPECSLRSSGRMRRVYAERARQSGYDAFDAGRTGQARRELWDACRYRPWRLSNWGYLAASWLPRGLVRMLRGLKRGSEPSGRDQR